MGGGQGIGKATLAYRMARFVLAHPDPAAQSVQGADVSTSIRIIPWRVKSRTGATADC
jgi:hypothetical protein